MGKIQTITTKVCPTSLSYTFRGALMSHIGRTSDHYKCMTRRLHVATLILIKIQP